MILPDFTDEGTEMRSQNLSKVMQEVIGRSRI